MENAGDDGIFVHVPFFENLLDGERVNDIRLASFAELRLVRFGRNFDGAFDTFGFGGFFIIGHYDKIIT